MKSRQKKKYEIIIFEYWNSRARVLAQDFSKWSLKQYFRAAKRYKAIKNSHRKRIEKELYKDWLPY